PPLRHDRRRERQEPRRAPPRPPPRGDRPRDRADPRDPEEPLEALDATRPAPDGDRGEGEGPLLRREGIEDGGRRLRGLAPPARRGGRRAPSGSPAGGVSPGSRRWGGEGRRSAPSCGRRRSRASLPRAARREGRKG